MNPASERRFRIAVGIAQVLGLGTRLYFQRKVKGRVKATSTHEHRETFFYKLVLASYLLIFVYVLSRRLDFARLHLPASLRWIGGGILVAALGLFGWTHQTLGANWSGTLDVYKDHTLVTDGPYRRIRHPMYCAMFLTGIGNALLSANWLIAVTNLGSITWMYTARVVDEEAMLLDHFGDTYRQYMAKRGRLLPALRT